MANVGLADLSSYLNQTSSTTAASKDKTVETAKKNPYDLTMEDFLTLMMVELQNQTIDDTADTGEMLNQMVQMQMVTALTNMTDASLMTYASSLVGKEVTIGTYDNSDTIKETVITVIGTGTSNGEQVIFGSDGKTYQLSQIMAIGRLPAVKDVDTDNKTDTEDKTEGTDKVDGTDKTEGTDSQDKTDSTDKVDGTDGTDTDNNTGDTTEVPDDRPVVNPDDTKDTTEEDKDPVVEPTQEVG